ncbi:MAG TPA: hypothetical protein VJ436_08750 [Anaerolineales bacterium]|nr:hypothetical protein [Anaerolineales bacterium]
MTTPEVPHDLERGVTSGPQAQLEKMYIEEYLHNKGYDLQSVRELPEDEAKQLMREACMYASARLAEVESRAQFRRDIQGPTG